MKIIKALQKHINDISISQESTLHKEVDSFISQNPNLNEEDLLNEIYSKYGTQIKFLEDAVQCKAIVSIRSWVATFGFFFILGLVVCIIYGFYCLTHM